MKYVITVGNKGEDRNWEESYYWDVEFDKATVLAEKLIEDWNNSLRTERGEVARELLCIRSEGNLGKCGCCNKEFSLDHYKYVECQDCDRLCSTKCCIRDDYTFNTCNGCEVRKSDFEYNDYGDDNDDNDNTLADHDEE